MAKGRSRVLRGEEHGHAKLSEEQVLEILLDPRPQPVLAQAYNVTRHTISDIKRKNSWRHLSTDPVKSKRDMSVYAGNSKYLNDEKVRLIRASTEKAATVAEQYGITVWTVYDIRKGRSWSHVI